MEITATSSKSNIVSAWVCAIICGLYALSPIDIIPDVIPVVGWADDVLAE